MKRFILMSVSLVLLLYTIAMSLLAFQQEKLIFFPEKLPLSHRFSFDQEFEEVVIPAPDGIRLHGLLFKTETPKGLIFYLHGNAGSVDSWGWVAKTYTDLGYDIFVLDYRGYGKSEGSISSENQFYSDAQAAYDALKARYPENQVIVAGYSIGSAAAAKLAADNQPRMLVLQAPYYSLADLARNLYPVIPGFLLKYKFETFRFIRQTSVPVAIFHGEQDEIIYHGSSLKLKQYLKPTDNLILLKGQGHNGMNENPDYKAALAQLLHEKS